MGLFIVFILVFDFIWLVTYPQRKALKNIEKMKKEEEKRALEDRKSRATIELTGDKEADLAALRRAYEERE